MPAALRDSSPANLHSRLEQEFVFSSQDFERVRRLIYEHAGIHLHAGKQAMVYSRLSRRLRETGHRSFSDYLGWLQRAHDDAARSEWQQFVNGLTTNLTSFFREAHHFDSLAQDLRDRQGRNLRIWCAAASTGEEPYSIAMVANETLGARPRAEIVASTREANSGWVLMPVPTAVPPSATSESSSFARAKRRTPRSIWPA